MYDGDPEKGELKPEDIKLIAEVFHGERTMFPASVAESVVRIKAWSKQQMEGK